MCIANAKFSFTTGLDKLSMASKDGHLPKQQHQQKQKEQSEETQKANSHKKDKATEGSSVFNQTAFTDARQAAMLSQGANISNNTLVNETKGLLSNVTGVGDVTNSTQQPASSNTSSEDEGLNIDDGDKPVSPAKKQRKKKPPRIIFPHEDECRRSSPPADDDGDDNDNDDNDDEKPISSMKGKTAETISKKEATPPSTSKPPSVSPGVGSQQQYTDSYQSSEFRPYNPLSHALEEKLFPHPFGPANFFNYPGWPDKTECLDVVENLSSWVKSSRMDIDMTKRGHE